MAEQKPIPTRPLDPQDTLLRDKLTEEITGQPQRMNSRAHALEALQ